MFIYSLRASTVKLVGVICVALTVLITLIENGEIYVSAQSDDALDRPISSYNFASARFLHIEGVRFDLSDDACFEVLLNGGV